MSKIDTAKLDANLIKGILDAFDQLQDLEYLVRGAYLAVDGLDDPDSGAAAAVVRAVQNKLSDIVEVLKAANDADIAALKAPHLAKDDK